MYIFHSGNVNYEIKKGYIHLYVTDDFFNQVEVVATIEQLELFFKIILRK